MLAGFTRKYSPLEILTPEELESIHRGALYVLQTTGMRIEHDPLLEQLAERGCQVDLGEKRVLFPPGLVEECLRQCPSCFMLRARDRDKDLMVGGDTVYFMQGMGMRHVDLETWETRPATTAEHRKAMIVADALENTHLAEGWEIYTERQGMPPIMAVLENLASAIRYSSKTQVAGNIQDSEIFAIKMAKAVGTDLLPEIDMASPLTIYTGAIEAAQRYIQAGIPITPALSITMGSEGPATMAGSVALAVAMTMAWVVITQVIRPGAPMALHHGIGPMDMRRGNAILGTPIEGLTSVMMNQMLRRYGVPIWTTAGFASNSKKIDYQAAYEKALPSLVSLLSGGHVHLFQGGSAIELLYHPVLSILDDDVAGWIGRFLQGVVVTDETLAIDLINQVGPIPGHYLSTAHTREWWRKEQWLPQSADLEAYPVWVRSGKKDALALAQERMEEILSTHEPKPLTPEQEQSVEDVLREARQFYRDRGTISDVEWSTYMHTLEMGD
ncbi:MAG: trimethylamine methyltransferase family protein [Anaerolineae bacterium]|jgi:trimethylamine--corrinoid protein Co-methyltransferase